MAYLNNKLNSANYVTVKITDDPITNGNNLLSTYDSAKILTPNNNVLSPSNRLAIILPPAIYDLEGDPFVLDAQYIDIIGSTNDKSKHYIKSSFDQPYYGSLIHYVSANNIKLMNLTIENTNITYTLQGGNGSDIAAYSPDDYLNLTYIENVEFKSNANSISMRTFAYYNGTFINVTAGDFSFGTNGGANGVFENCKGGNLSFGTSGEATGVFKNCNGGNRSFNL
jgi:hypothetical protein